MCVRVYDCVQPTNLNFWIRLVSQRFRKLPLLSNVIHAHVSCLANKIKRDERVLFYIDILSEPKKHLKCTKGRDESLRVLEIHQPCEDCLIIRGQVSWCFFQSSKLGNERYYDLTFMNLSSLDFFWCDDYVDVICLNNEKSTCGFFVHVVQDEIQN